MENNYEGKYFRPNGLGVIRTGEDSFDVYASNEYLDQIFEGYTSKTQNGKEQLLATIAPEIIEAVIEVMCERDSRWEDMDFSASAFYTPKGGIFTLRARGSHEKSFDEGISIDNFSNEKDSDNEEKISNAAALFKNMTDAVAFYKHNIRGIGFSTVLFKQEDLYGVLTTGECDDILKIRGAIGEFGGTPIKISYEHLRETDKIITGACGLELLI